MTNDEVGFAELREFIEHCIHPDKAPPSLEPFLISSHDGNSALLDLLGSKSAAPSQDQVVENLWREHLHSSRWRLATQQKLPLGSDVPIRFVPWTLLEPQGLSLVEVLRQHFATLSTTRKEKYDDERWEFVCRFNPTDAHVGEAGFQGYVAFCFASKGLTVLECPKFGNAIYVMPLGDWESLSQMSKTELLDCYSDEVGRIIHGDRWRSELERWLGPVLFPGC